MRRFKPSGGFSSACCLRRRRWLAVVVTLLGGLALAPAAQAVGPAAFISLQLSQPLISADGVSQTVATATVTDALGQPVPGETGVVISFAAKELVTKTTRTGLYSSISARRVCCAS